jgi:hypothetical protein
MLEQASWTWGLSLIVLTIAFHATGAVVMAAVTHRIHIRLEKQEFDPLRTIPIVIGIVAAVGLILGTMHGVEAFLWAAAYVWLGAFGSLMDALFYAMGAMTTLGAAGLDLPLQWRMMGVLEAMNGMLLFGISTAFIFAEMQVYWPMLSRKH